MVRFFYSRELEFGAAEFLQGHSVAGDFHLVNCSCEWRFDFDSIFVTEFVLATQISDKDNAICREFPKCCI